MKGHRLAEITNCVNDVLPQPLSSRTVRRRLRSCGFAREKIPKQIVINRVNRACCMFWCRQKLSWKANVWKSVIFTNKTQIEIGQNRKVYIGENHMKPGSHNVLEVAKVKKYQLLRSEHFGRNWWQY